MKCQSVVNEIEIEVVQDTKTKKKKDKKEEEYVPTRHVPQHLST